MKLSQLIEANKIQPTSKQVENYVNNNFYVYDDETGRIVVEDTYKRVRGKYEIRYSDTSISVSPDYVSNDKNVIRMMDNRAKQIQKEILTKAATERTK